MTSEQGKIKKPSWDCELRIITEFCNEKEQKLEVIDGKARNTKMQDFIIEIPLEPGNERPKQKAKSTKTAKSKETGFEH